MSLSSEEKTGLIFRARPDGDTEKVKDDDVDITERGGAVIDTLSAP